MLTSPLAIRFLLEPLGISYKQVLPHTAGSAGDPAVDHSFNFPRKPWAVMINALQNLCSLHLPPPPPTLVPSFKIYVNINIR